MDVKKSKWQMFMALVFLRLKMRFREPGMFFVQIILPVVYICLGVFLSDLSNPSASEENEAVISYQMYTSDFNPYLYGFQNLLSNKLISHVLSSSYIDEQLRDFENNCVLTMQ